MRQAIAGLEVLLAGRTPNDILLAGDSAGGNLALQILLHTVNPIPDIPTLPSLAVPPSPLSLPPYQGQKFLGAFMLSPYLDILARNPACRSYVTNVDSDIMPQYNQRDFGELVMSGLPNLTSHPEVAKVLPYLDSQLAPGGFYADIPKAVESVLVYSGGGESMRDDIIEFAEKLKKTGTGVDGKKMETKLLVDEFGVHLEPMMDFFAGIPEDKLVPVTKDIVEWVGERVSV